MATEGKKKGRQKVEMAKMSKKSNLLVTFSKRRSGLFKKASELSTLCGAEVGIIVFSPGKKVFSFGHPSVETIIDRFHTHDRPSRSDTHHRLVEAHRNASIGELNAELTQVLNQLEAEKKRGEELDRMRKASQTQCWWEAPIEELGLQQLEQLKSAMEELKSNVTKQADKLLIEASNPRPPFFGVNSTRPVLPPFDNNGTGFNPNGQNFGHGGGFFGACGL